MRIKEPEFLGEKMTDFERNLFLKRQVNELLEQLKKYTSGQEIRKRDFIIGQMQSEIDELKYNLKESEKPYHASYEQMNKTQKKNFKYKIRDEASVRLKNQIQILEQSIIKRNKRIEELENELETYKNI